jgi:hypothetical protein
MRVKLTDSAVRAYEPRAAQYTVGDAACPGLCVRITPKGVKTFAFAYRNKATRKVEWLTLGRYPDLSLTKARELANDARKAVANGWQFRRTASTRVALWSFYTAKTRSGRYLEDATLPSCMSIPSSSRQIHSSAIFPSRIRNIAIASQVTTLPAGTAWVPMRLVQPPPRCTTLCDRRQTTRSFSATTS